MPRRDSNLPSHPGRPYYYPGGGPGGGNYLTIEEADSRYFRPEVGGSIRGNTRFHGLVLDGEDRPFTRLTTSNRAPTTSDEAPEGTLWAYTGSPGSGGVSQVQVEDDNTSPTVASLLKFQGDVLSVVGGVAEFDLDGRYYPRDEIDDLFLTKDAADSRFFRPDVGGLISGDLVFGGSLEDTSGRPITRLQTSNRAPTTSDEAPEGTLWAYTGNPGQGTATRVQIEDDITGPLTAELLKFPGDLINASGPVAELDFDGRYYTKEASNERYYTKEDSDGRFFRPDVGGLISGDVVLTGTVEDGEARPFARLQTSNRAPTASDEAPVGTLWAYTGVPGDGGPSSVQIEDDTEGPAVASLLKFQGDVFSVVGGVAEFDLDGRYAALSHRHPWGELDDAPDTATRWPSWSEVSGEVPFYTKNEADGRYFRPAVGGTVDGDVVFAGVVEDPEARPFTRLQTSSRAPTGSDQAPEGTLWAYAGPPGSGGVSQVQVEGSDGTPRTVSLFRFTDIQIGGSGAVASISFDSRYRKIGDRLAWGDLDDVPGVFPPENHTLESHSGSLGWGRLTGYPSLTAGAGLTGGGSLSSSRTVAVDFGTGSNQVPRGNHNHDARRLRPAVGGNISGGLFLTGAVEDGDGRPFTRLTTSNRAPTDSDQAPEGTLWAYTGSAGPGGGVTPIQVEDDSLGPVEASVLKFQGSVLDVVGGVASLDLDGRYSALGHTHSWGEISGKPASYTPTAHTHPWGEVTGKPATATRWPSWSEATNKPSTFAPSAHTHGDSDLPTEMSAKEFATTLGSIRIGGGTGNYRAYNFTTRSSNATWYFDRAIVEYLEFRRHENGGGFSSPFRFDFMDDSLRVAGDLRAGAVYDNR